ncbi:MAG: phage portal protein [Synergistaceae bacterium]|nr:phage portal protein [Candidatus Omnitrophota bacterium]
MQIPFLKKIFKRSTVANPTKWLLELFGAKNSKTGVTVNETSAMYYTTVYSCVKIISESLASLPLILYERLERGKRRAVEHPLYGVLHDLANPYMTSFVFRETLQNHLLTYGNAFCEIQRNKAGEVIALWPLLPDRTSIEIVNDKKLYTTRVKNEEIKLPADRVLHIPGLGFDGLKGYSPITMAMEAIGLGLAAEEFGAKFYANGMNIGGVAEHPSKLSEQGAKNLRESINKTYAGLGNAYRVLLLEEGMKFQRINITPNEGQFLETRKFQKAEIAGFYRVPPHMIGDLDRATFSNIEHQSLEFVKYTLRPWLVRWEQAIVTQILSPFEREKYFAEFLVEGLLRGDLKSRYEAYAVGRNSGWLSADEIRELENMNPLPDGKGEIYLVPLNMVPVDMVMNPPETQPPQESSLKTDKETRSEERDVRAVENRNRTARSWQRTYSDAYSRIVRREKNDITRLVEKKLRNVSDFVSEIEKFYSGKFREYVLTTLRPVVNGLAEQIAAIAAEEVGGNPSPEELEKFYNEYLDSMAERHIESSRGQLIALAEKEEKPDEAILTRLDEWEETRPAKSSDNEVQRLTNAITKFAWLLLGVTTLRWVTMGSDPCPLCQSMNGKVVSIEKSFIEAGSEMNEGGVKMQVYHNIGHPPLHQGCVCGIVPG